MHTVLMYDCTLKSSSVYIECFRKGGLEPLSERILQFAGHLNVRYKIVCLIYMYAFPFTGTILLFTGTGIKYSGPGKNSSYLGVVNVNLNGTGVV